LKLILRHRNSLAILS